MAPMTHIDQGWSPLPRLHTCAFVMESVCCNVFDFLYDMNGSSRKKYTPKGGHLVDFEKRLTPKLKKILSKEQEQARASVHECETYGQDSTDMNPSPCMAMVLWSGEDAVDQTTPGNRSGEKRSTKSVVPSKAEIAWKPPGCLKRTLWKRPIRQKKTPGDVIPVETPVASVCPSCIEYDKGKETMQAMKAELEEKQKQLHLKMIRVESMASKCSRERKAFEEYKVRCCCTDDGTHIFRFIYIYVYRNKSWSVYRP